jgi:hypothetical protein
MKTSVPHANTGAKADSRTESSKLRVILPTQGGAEDVLQGIVALEEISVTGVFVETDIFRPRGSATLKPQDGSLGKRYRLPLKADKDELRRRLRRRKNHCASDWTPQAEI